MVKEISLCSFFGARGGWYVVFEPKRAPCLACFGLFGTAENTIKPLSTLRAAEKRFRSPWYCYCYSRSGSFTDCRNGNYIKCNDETAVLQNLQAKFTKFGTKICFRRNDPLLDLTPIARQKMPPLPKGVPTISDAPPRLVKPKT